MNFRRGEFSTGEMGNFHPALTLRDFCYDTDLLGRDEIDERALVGLRGIVQISHTRLSGRSFLNLERFAPASDWEEVTAALIHTPGQEQGHDL